MGQQKKPAASGATAAGVTKKGAPLKKP